MSLELSLIIPAYNEAARLGKTLQAAFAHLETEAYKSEIIVVDDGSTDETASVVTESFARLANRVPGHLIRVAPNRGKGHAVRAGLLAARAPIALFSDADLSTPLTEMPKLIAPIRAGQYDLIFGSRALDRRLIGMRQPWRREQSGRIFNLVVRLATKLPFWDTQCGFKAFRLDVCRPVIEAGRIDRFGFDVELLYMAHAAGLRLHECPVRWNDVAGSKVSFLNGLYGFMELRQLRREAQRGAYDSAIEAARAAARNMRGRVPIFSAAPPSDVSRELASATRRI